VEQEAVTDPEAAPHRARHVALVEVGLVGAFESRDVLVVTAEHVGGPREALEVLGAQRLFSIRAVQGVEGAFPRLFAMSATAELEVGGSAHSSPEKCQRL
jgi:hypothetical protein